MNKKGFTLVEILAVVMLIGILAAIVVAVYPGSKGTAIGLRCQNAAGVLNEAEKNLQTYNGSTAPGLGTEQVTITTMDVASRIQQLKDHAFISSDVSPGDVSLTVTNGEYVWKPAQ